MAQDADSYPFLSVVEDYLAAVPEDDQIRALAMGELVKKGLLSVAAEVGQGCPTSSPNASELQNAAAGLRANASDVLDVAATDARFEPNLAALRIRGDAATKLAEKIEQAWAEIAPGLTLHRANDGNLFARGRRSDGRRIWIPAALDFASKVETGPDRAAVENTMPSPLLLDGVGNGLWLPRLHAVTKRTHLNYSAAIYVVEPNVRGLALALRLHDCSEALSDERVYLLAGPDAWAQWQALLTEDVLLPEPQQMITATPWPGQAPSPAESVLQEVNRRRASLCQTHVQRAREHYQGRDAAWWARRFESPEPANPLRVLCITSRYTTFLQYSMNDLIEAFRRAGMHTKLIIERNDHALMPPHGFAEAIADFRPDLVFVIDHHRHEYTGRFINEVPYVCWIQDELPNLFEADVGARLGPLDFTIGYGLTRCVLECGYPEERFMPCKLAINPEKFAPAADGDELDPALRCDVAYVSHHSETPEAMHDRLRALAGDEGTLRLMDGFFEEARPLMRSERFHGAYDLERLLSAFEGKVGAKVSEPALRQRLMGMYIRPLADRVVRHTTLEWIADWAESAGRTLHLYGRGWEGHPRFSRFARGVAGHGAHLGLIARSATINLHCGMIPALHQRVLEVVAGGGFMLIRRHPDDFYNEADASVRRFLAERGIHQPTRIPFDELPADWIAYRRRKAEAEGTPVPDMVDITAPYLLVGRVSGNGDRDRYANLAFEGLEQITFDSPQQFAERAEHFIRHADQRRVIVEGMQHVVKNVFTYDALQSQLIRFLTDRLRSAARG